MITTSQEINNYFKNIEKEKINEIQLKLEDILKDIKWLKDSKLL
jgi:hypothetical protein